MFTIHVALSCLIIYEVASNQDHHQHEIEPCHIGNVVQNECNRCLCSSKTIFDCISIPCTTNVSLGEIEESFGQTCLPKQMYVKNTTTCICNEHGKWPHKNCYDTFQSLPADNIETHKCDPNTYTTIDCNVCRCSPDGEFLSHQCTKNICDDEFYIKSRRNNNDTHDTEKIIYSNCELNNWYSLVPCQLCLCIKQNQLTCNSVRNLNKDVESGSQNLQLCNKSVIKEILELLPENRRSSSSINSINDNTDVLNETHLENDEGRMSILITVKKDLEVNKSSKAVLDPNTVEHNKHDEDNPDSIIKQDTNKNISDIASLTAQLNIGTSIQKTASNVNNSDNIIKIDVPNEMMNKIIEMTLRKSLISLTNQTTCVPGTTSTNECNTCHCMKNGKLLCTVNKCK